MTDSQLWEGITGEVLTAAGALFAFLKFVTSNRINRLRTQLDAQGEHITQIEARLEALERLWQ